MNASTDRLEFAPPPQPGPVRAFVLAVIAHVLLMLALTWGINWNRESENQTAEAELWSSVPQQAAPKLVEATPTPPPPPPPAPRVEKKVEAPVAPPPPPPAAKEPDIALEREKKKQQLAKQRQEEQEKQKKLEAKLEAKKKLEEQKREQLAEKKEAEERKKKDELAKTAKDKAKQLADAKRADVLRRENLARMQAMAGATGDSTATGTAARTSGPSANYAAKIKARIRPYIRHPEEVPGNPPVVIEVKTSPDGTIVGQRVVKSSGNPAWDESALRAIIATGSLPRNEEGRVPSPMEIVVRHRD